ncbi:MAG: ATPase [Lachnospiraceae bacterium]
MDTIIKQISEIENRAAAVMEEANAQKKVISLEMNQKTADFDQELDAEMQKKIAKLQADMEVDMNAKLETQRANAASCLLQMEKNYEQNHQEYARRLFQQLIGE